MTHNKVTINSTEQWNEYFHNKIAIASKESDYLFAFILRKLNQFHIFGNYEVNDVLSEVYIIGQKKIEDGEEVKDADKWIRGIARNVIRTFKRKAKDYYRSLDYENIPDEYNQNSIHNLKNFNFSKEATTAMNLAIKDLPKENQEIVKHKMIDDMSWKEVQSKINKELGRTIAVNSLRQRGQRIRHYLRSKCEEAIKKND